MATIDGSDPHWMGHWMGRWTYQCHIGGVDANGDAAELTSPAYTYDWEVRSPAAYLHCTSGGTGEDFEWEDTVGNA
jgi:hypothetical protein